MPVYFIPTGLITNIRYWKVNKDLEHRRYKKKKIEIKKLRPLKQTGKLVGT